MGQPIMHVEIIGRDARALQRFYGELFGWRISPAGGPETGFYGLVDSATSGVAGGIGQAEAGQSRVTFYVQVPDMQAALDQAAALGGKTLMPPMDVPGGPRIALFADPDGNVVGLMQG